MYETLERARLEQIRNISSGEEIFVHGSIGHAALMGEELPNPIKLSGAARDIDIYIPGTNIENAKLIILDSGLGAPSPVDVGLCGLAERTSAGSLVLRKDGVSVEIDDKGIMQEKVTYKTGGGVAIQSFSPEGMLLAHLLEPTPQIRLSHPLSDYQLMKWMRDNNIQLPEEVAEGVREFHDQYKKEYPLGNFLNQVSKLYVAILPEIVRSKTRAFTHGLMERHAGRKSSSSNK